MATKLFEPADPDVLYLVDLSSFLLRAYHAIAPLSAPSGEPTHAVHGTVTMLERLFRERKPRLVAIAMDAGRETFRKEIYPEYKANRPPAPEDLKIQIVRSEEVVRASGLCVFKQTGVEADDLIASAVRGAVAEGLKVVVVGADKDLMQLVSDEVVLWDTFRNKVFGPKEVEDRFGVPVHKLGDLLALMGDSSDNIPGVPSVGPKTAATLLNEYQDLDGVFSHLHQVKRKKLRQTLEEHEDAARLSRKLVTLKSDCAVEISREALSFGAGERLDVKRLTELYETLGFTRQLASLREGTAAILATSGDQQRTEPEVPLRPLPPVEVLRLRSDLERLRSRLTEGRWTFEIHTTQPDAHRGDLIGLALASDDACFYLPFGHRYVGAPEQLDPSACTLLLESLAESDSLIAAHDVKRNLVIAAQAERLPELTQAHDTSLAAYLIDAERSHSVESLAGNVGVTVPSFDSIAKKGRKCLPLDEIEIDEAAKFAGARVVSTHRVAKHQRDELAGAGLLELFDEMELPLTHLLAEMELRGVLIDAEGLAELGSECERELNQLEERAHEAAGQKFNVNSPRQLETILFDELGLKPLKRTKTSRSTDAQTLEALSEQHALPDLILQIRQIAKLKGTYIEALPALRSPRTGRIHCSWEQGVAATGRISSTEPNLQNIPIRSELGRKIRSCFVAPTGYQLLSADYSQIELRVLAHLSQDQRLLEAFRTGQDIHLRTAMEIFELPEEQITKELRSRAKAVNFGVIYGQGESGLAKALGIERRVASKFIAAYFRRYEGVTKFMNDTLDKARQGRAVQSISGRRRLIPDIKSGNRARRLAAERIAMNMPIQGSAADILKRAMLELRTPPSPGARMVLTVHDELVFEVPSEEVELASRVVKQAMEGAYALDVPLDVSVGSGSNWNAAH